MHNKTTVEPLLEVNNLTVKFGDFTAVDDITFAVKPGEVLGILGGNGAGKSTTMKVLGGILRPNIGEVIIGGYNLNKSSESNNAKYITGYCPDVGGIIAGESPREHVKLLLTLHQKTHLYDEGIQLLHMFGLSELIDSPSSGFSHGQSRRLSVALATLASQKVLILDEPFDGVDPIGVEAINETIKQAKAKGLAIIISTHLQDLLVNVADNIIIMRKSKIAAAEPSSKFSGDKGKKYYQQILEGFNGDEKTKNSFSFKNVFKRKGK